MIDLIIKFKLVLICLTVSLYFSQPVFAITARGAIDFHVHSAPDVTPRSVDDFELARMAAAAQMKAVVLKNHLTPTADRAVLVNQIVPQIKLYGGVVLNHSVGGINPFAVKSMYQLGKGKGKVVWFPTIDAAYHLKVFQKPGNGLTIGTDEQLKPETEAVLELIKKYDLVLGTGHLSPSEIKLLVKKAHNMGIKRILITHAMADVPGLSGEDMAELAKMGAFLELAYVNDLMGPTSAIAAHRAWHRVSVAQMAEAIKIIGAEHFVVSTDLGRAFDPLPVQGYQRFMNELIELGISSSEIKLMTQDNPAYLLLN